MLKKLWKTIVGGSDDIIAIDKLKKAIDLQIQSGKSPKDAACAVLPEFYELLNSMKNDFPNKEKASEIIDEFQYAIETGSKFFCKK